MSIREARLANDYKSLRSLCLFSQSVKIKILETRGTPPEYYRIQISNCKGIESVSGNTPKYRTEHILIVANFPEDYPDPGQLPVAKLETPIFHPNVYSNGRLCFQGSDLNTVDEPLDSLVKRVISMIQYQNRRFGVPANSTAKDWATSNEDLLDRLSNDSDTAAQSRARVKWK